MTELSAPQRDTTGSRAQKIAAVMRQVRAIAAERPEAEIDGGQLARIAPLLQALAAEPALFPDRDFPSPAPGEPETLFLLSLDPDLRNALYLFRPAPGMSTPPHNHDTYVVIAGIEGEEPNTIWRRAEENDDGDDKGRAAGRATLAVEKRLSIGPGQTAWLLPHEIHHIAIEGERAIKHLHLYGRSLYDLPYRRDFNVDAGTWRRHTETSVVLAPVTATPLPRALQESATSPPVPTRD